MFHFLCRRDYRWNISLMCSGLALSVAQPFLHIYAAFFSLPVDAVFRLIGKYEYFS